MRVDFRFNLLLAFVLTTLGVWNAAGAQEFPQASRNITFVLPYAAGGPTDKAARDLAQAMSRAMGGHPIVIENVTGASGSIGTAKVARATNDGYTLLFTHIAQATLSSFFRKLPYDVEKDFEYLGMVSENPMNLIARPTLAANHFSELVQWLQANNGKVTIGTGHRKNQNLRRAGEDLAIGQVALKQGLPLRPAEIGLVASLGIGEVTVYRKLRVAFFSTGDELVSIGSTPGEGQIFDSNRYTLYGMLVQIGRAHV